jgi:hypothetical protein
MGTDYPGPPKNLKGARNVHKIRNWSSLLPTAATALLAALFVTAGCHQAQQPAATTAAKPSIQLQTYTAPDQSASAGVPAGWQVSAGKDTVIQMTGPHGETVFLGNTIIAKNGAFKAGQRGPNGTELSMPYSAPLAQKMIMIFEQNAAVAGKPAPQVTVDSATPIQAAPVLGQCGRFVASAAGGQEPLKVMAVYCSFPVDSGGAYKNVMLLAQAPAAVAAQSAPIAQAIFQSYRIPPPWLQKKLAPFNAPPPPMAVRSGGSGGGGMNSSTILSEMGADNAANCFDLGVLRETPQYDLPRSCGGLKPD